jgi:signal peptidase I
MNAFMTRRPERGETIAFERDQGRDKSTKRVLAIGGDIVSGSGSMILVNGQPSPYVGVTKNCGRPPATTNASEEPVTFGPTTIPEGSLFVVGDNLANSYDSRFDGYGFVTLTEVNGKPLYIYLSPNASRLGC